MIRVKERLQWAERVNKEKVTDTYIKHFGSSYMAYRDLWDKSGEDFLPEFPLHLDVEVIDSCNLLCTHCFRNKKISSKMNIKINSGDIFPIKEYENILSECKSSGLKAINLGFSGECLLRSDLVEMINIAFESNILDIRLITNGTLLTKDLINKLLTSPLTFLSISVDAGKAETFKLLKNKDCFHKVEEVIKYIYHKKEELEKDFPLIRASFYTSPENINEKDIFVEKFKDYVDFIDFQAFKDINKIKRHKGQKRCTMPFQRLAVFANGDIAPCCSFFSKKLIIGNIKDSSLKDIWKSEKINKVREALINKKPLPVCRECLYTVAQ